MYIAHVMSIYKWICFPTALGTKNDNFVRCPQSALDWKTRRFRMLEEIALSEADIICLQVPSLLTFINSHIATRTKLSMVTPFLILISGSGPLWFLPTRLGSTQLPGLFCSQAWFPLHLPTWKFRPRWVCHILQDGQVWIGETRKQNNRSLAGPKQPG